VLEIKSGFLLSSQHLNAKQRRMQKRKQRELQLGKDDSSTSKNLVGMMAIKIQFDKNGQPFRLVSYGSLPLKNT
jgi:hypothetical protein